MQRAGEEPAERGDGWMMRKRQLMTQPFVHAVERSPIPVIITDANEDDHPIVFVNGSFLTSTGYSEREVLGRNCRFLQGADTDPEEVARLRDALKAREAVQVDLKNYRKDGTAFWNELHVAPIFDDRGGVMYFIGSQIDVTERVESRARLAHAHDDLERIVADRTRELEEAAERSALLAKEVTHRVRNSLALLAALVEIQRRAARDPREETLLREVQGRIRAVGRIQHLLDDVAVGNENIDLRDMLNLLRSDLDESAEATVELVTDGPLNVGPERALPVALAVTELVLNAQKHAFVGRGEDESPGRILIRMARDDHHALVDVEDDGLGLPDGFQPSGGRGTGMLVVRSQIEQAGGAVEAMRGEELGGALFRLRIPLT